MCAARCRFSTQIFAASIVIGWIVTFLRRWREPVTLGFALAASVIVGWLGTPNPDYVMTPWAAWSMTALGLAILLRVPAPKQTLKGAFVLIGIPWLVFVTAVHASHIGRFSLYAGGDDMWMFQRFAYRIYLQGYWLQGGEPTFWFQPFYRWIAGALHMIFGDSSMGEFWWDAICLMVSALFAHQVVSAAYGFRWGLAAAVLCLTIVMQGPPWMFVGIGLSDIASAGFIYLAALVIASARLRGEIPLGTAIGAGILASIGFFTRLNNLPMAFASSAFGLSLVVPSRGWWRAKTWWPHVSWNALFGVAGAVLAAMMLFTLRTYHYTGRVLDAARDDVGQSRAVAAGPADFRSGVWNVEQPDDGVDVQRSAALCDLRAAVTDRRRRRRDGHGEHQAVPRCAAGARGVFSGGVFGGAGGKGRGLCGPILHSPAWRRLRADRVRDRVAGHESVLADDRESSQPSDPVRE